MQDVEVFFRFVEEIAGLLSYGSVMEELSIGLALVYIVIS
jgi:hypothetical protein